MSNMNSDPLLDALFEGDEFTSEEGRGPIDPRYGEGKHANAVLREVTPGKASDYSRTIMLRVTLENEEKPFVIFADAPYLPHENGDPDRYERGLKAHQIGLSKIKSLVHATGQWVTFNDRGYADQKAWPASFVDFRDEAAYNKLVALFTGLVGSKMPINVKIREYQKKDGSTGIKKDVWGMEARA